MKTKTITKQGGRQENQDYYGNVHTDFGEVIIVCDGVGGHAGGSLASKLAVEVIIQKLSATASEDPRNALHNAIQAANFEIFRRTVKDSKLKGMGTTVTILLIQKEKAIIGHVGDSRIYQFRKGKIIYRTTDHSKVAEMVKRGILAEEEAQGHAASNVILRALGTDPVVDIDFKELDYRKGDRFLLCTDGIHDMISDKELTEFITEDEDVDNITQKLVDYIDRLGKDGGNEHDNLTAALVETSENSLAGKKTLSIRSLIPYGVIVVLILYIAISSFLFHSPENLDKSKEVNSLIIVDPDKEKDSIKQEISGSKDSIQSSIGKSDRTEDQSEKPESQNGEYPRIHKAGSSAKINQNPSVKQRSLILKDNIQFISELNEMKDLLEEFESRMEHKIENLIKDVTQDSISKETKIIVTEN